MKYRSSDGNVFTFNFSKTFFEFDLCVINTFIFGIESRPNVENVNNADMASFACILVGLVLIDNDFHGDYD